MPIISGRFSIVDIMKIEPRASLLHAPALLRYNKALDKREALETLATKLYIIKDLTALGLFQEGRRKAPNASFDLTAKVGRAMAMSSLRSRHSKISSATPKIPISIPIWEATAGSNHKWQWNGIVWD
jgi:hypothetical protein